MRKPPARPAVSLDEALALLRAQARPEALAGMAGFGMGTEGRLGLSMPMLRQLGRQIGRDHGLALALAASGIPDAQILASLVAEPALFTVGQMNTWVSTLNAWDSCDQACINAFVRTPLAWGRVPAWAARLPEFERRAAFALLAALAVHDKAAGDERFVEVLPLIERHANDERNFVKKAVNWALRQIGKRNTTLLPQAIACAERVAAQPSRAARWIAADALRELRAHEAST
ncbi:MAG TPA: DNA alkylation repair protein [Ideonella sp.]|uniref:DNA alkylation repair protein n=1 Tax=Ideonella sp. TaxID=1929293 RepID=UPI002E37039A|nr:DNA alkylation repair protein [Ideonella sp.]HEX5684460.1 DNA alkylation repair protein [Ideonella sp.]